MIGKMRELEVQKLCDNACVLSVSLVAEYFLVGFLSCQTSLYHFTCLRDKVHV